VSSCHGSHRSLTAFSQTGGTEPTDADQVARDALGITGVALRESTFRRTLQALDADAPAGSALGGPPAARRPARRT